MPLRSKRFIPPHPSRALSPEELYRKDMSQKGPGDFSPRDPVECPDNCPNLNPDGLCDSNDTVCYYAEDGDLYWEEMYLKYPGI